MFVRKEKNKSGSITVEVLRKDRGKRSNVVVSIIGTAKDSAEIEALCNRAHRFIADRHGQNLFEVAEHEDEASRYDEIFAGIRQDQLCLVGPEPTSDSTASSTTSSSALSVACYGLTSRKASPPTHFGVPLAGVSVSILLSSSAILSLKDCEKNKCQNIRHRKAIGMKCGRG